MNRFERAVDKLRIPWNSPINAVDVYRAIKEHCTAIQKGPERFSWAIEDGVLYVDGTPLKRVGPRETRPDYNARADYWESKILERQEAWIDPA